MRYEITILLITYFTQASVIDLTQREEWRFVSSMEAPEGAVPYQVSLLLNGIGHICSGSILTMKWILTAAHCAMDQPKDLTVVVGAYRLDNVDTKYPVKQIIAYKDLRAHGVDVDIALIKVFGLIRFNDKVKPICLPDEDVKVGATLLLTGWDRSLFPVGWSPNYLQRFNVTTISNEQCKRTYNGYRDINHNYICTVSKEVKGACYGDTGGPLVEGNAVVGVLSWGKPCASYPGYPDVYTRVRPLKKWIRQQIKR